MNRRVFLCSVLVVTAVLASSSAAAAAPGDLDPTFGTGGKVVSDFDAESDTAPAVVLQKNNRSLTPESVFVSYDHSCKQSRERRTCF